MVKSRVRVGSNIGADHIRLWKNNQDGLSLGTIELGGVAYYFGVICDGCSAGNHSEVGAKLVAAYICGEIRMMLLAGAKLDRIAEPLFSRCIGYLRSVTSLTCVGDSVKSLEFIKNYFLCTVMGFIMSDKECLIFHAGDGVYVVGDEITRINQNNRPEYLGYQLVDREFLDLHGGELPRSFETRSFSLLDVNKFAICSDGVPEGDLSFIWGHEHPMGLLRKLRVMTNHKELTDDDCTVITVELIDEQPIEGGEPK